MGKSFKKTPVFPNTKADSDKQDKKLANQRLRSAVKAKLKVTADFDEIVLPELKEISDVWDFAKDGKHYCEGN